MQQILRLTPEGLDSALDALGEVLHACVGAGASVGFVEPFGPEDARAFWRDAVFPGVRQGGRALWVARDGGRIVGTVQLITALMPNQTHRADVAKMLVHPAARRQGTARALMAALEAEARALGLRLLVLDTRTPDAAEHLYLSLGFERAGVIPGYAIAAEDPARFDDTLVMFKRLGPA
jgi:ribosomal protein S18 acetylase RimI-like enzyme